MEDDFMEIGDSNLIPTKYGFYNKETEEKLDHNGLPLKDGDDGTPEEN